MSDLAGGKVPSNVKIKGIGFSAMAKEHSLHIIAMIVKMWAYTVAFGC